MKRLTLRLSAAILLALVCLAGTLPARAADGGELAGGAIRWQLADGTLTVSGRGAIPDFEDKSQKTMDRVPTPWYSLRGGIERIVLEEGITAVGDHAFADLTQVRDVSLPQSLRSIGTDAFRGCALTEADIHCPRIHILFPNDNPYLRKDLLRGFGRNGLIYDFKIYDDKLMEWRTDTDRLSMMLTRLKYGCFLNEDRRKTFLDILRNHLTEAAVAAAVENRMDLIILMEELQLFDADNIDAVLSELEIRGRHEMAASLSAWKHANLASASFDYSL